MLRFDPFRDFDLFDTAFGSRRPLVGGMDAYRRGDEVTLHFDLPGVDADSIDITVEKNQLTVTAERRWDADDDTTVLARGRAQGRFSRTLTLADSLDTDHIVADYTDGVLTLTVPVSEASKPRKITVGSAKAELSAA